MILVNSTSHYNLPIKARYRCMHPPAGRWWSCWQLPPHPSHIYSETGEERQHQVSHHSHPTPLVDSWRALNVSAQGARHERSSWIKRHTHNYKIKFNAVVSSFTNEHLSCMCADFLRACWRNPSRVQRIFVGKQHMSGCVPMLVGTCSQRTITPSSEWWNKFG